MSQNNLDQPLRFIESNLDAAARELEKQPGKSAAALILAVPPALARRLTMRMLPACAARMIGAMTPAQSAGLLADCDTYQAAAILRQLPARRREAILASMPDRPAMTCRKKLSHPEDSVGAWMSTRILAFEQNLAAGDALHRVVEAGNLGEGNAIPLVSESRQLLGYVCVRDLIRARSETLIARLQRDTEAVALPSKMSLRAAEHHRGWKDHDNLIVTDPHDQVEGLLRRAAMRKGLQLAHAKQAPANTGPVVNDIGRTNLSSMASLFSQVSAELVLQRPDSRTREKK